MKIITRTLLSLSLPALLLATGGSYATTLQNVESMTQPSGKSALRLHFDSKVSMPKSFILKQSSNIVLDFPDVKSSMKQRSKKFNSKSIKNVRFAKGAKKLRVMVSLNKLTKYTTSIQGNDVVITFDDNQAAPQVVAHKAVATGPTGAQRKAVAAKKRAELQRKQIAGQQRYALQQKQAENQRKQALVAQTRTEAKRKQVTATQKRAESKRQLAIATQKRAEAQRKQTLAAQQRVANQRKHAIAAQKRAQAAKNAASANRVAGSVVKQKSVRHQAVASNYVARPKNSTAKYRPTQKTAAYRPQARAQSNLLGPVEFHRTQAGGGQVIIKLPHPSTVVESRKVGNTVVVTLKNVSARQPRKRIDVLDFATPASYIDITRNGRDVQIKMLANAAFDFKSSQEGRDYFVNLNKPKRKIVRANPLAPKKKNYHGKKLSLNFQDIEVRSVLQLLADFTNKNIVVSDSVKGNITLRLKDVPWDQALDIVLESKGLAMRNNGNVIWVAPAVELDAKEQRDLQALKRKQSLEPLVTEYISVNYAKVEDMAELIKSAGGNKDDGSSLLSKRGNVSLDIRTNTLLIQDTASRVNDIRNMVGNLDVAVRQVSIESRIVVATDEFSKDLGTRFGVTTFGGNAALSGGINGTNAMVGDLLSNSSSVAVPNVADRLNFNLPAATGGAAKVALSLLSKDFLLDLELSALQAENKGEIVSTPRVVTADKKKALIEQGVEIGYRTESRSGGTTVAFKKAVLSLEVTPQITPDEHIIMDLVVNQDTVGDIIEGVPSINTREINTQVLVDNGQTVVLGGVHEQVKSNRVDSVPLLSDVPVIGKLFRRTTNRDQKRELLIFVTPKILK